MASLLLTDTAEPPQAQPATALAEWDLDVSFIESGDDIDKLIYMTDDGCGQTCQSACNSCR
jgi:FxLD family lantipeptide